MPFKEQTGVKKIRYFSVSDFSISISTTSVSHLQHLPVPKSIAQANKLVRFMIDTGLSVASSVTGVFLYPSFLAIKVLSESFFLTLIVVVPPYAISPSFLPLSYIRVSGIPINVMGCLLGVNNVPQEDKHDTQININRTFFIIKQI